MADTFVTNAGAGGNTYASDDIFGVHYPRVKISHGADGSATDTSTAAPLPAQLRNSAGTEIATAAAPLRTDPTGTTAQPITDNGGSLTVDGTVAVSGAVAVTDNAASLTVDHAALDLLHTADFDSGVGTDTTPAIGIAVAASGGAAVITGDVTNGLDVDVTRVQGVVTVNGSAVTQPVSDAGGSLTIDNAALAVVGGGVEATALRVTIASDSTGVLSIDDNAGSLTVDGTVTANLAAGTNNIGDVDVLTIAAGDNNIGNVDIVTMPNVTLAAGTNTNEVVGDAAHDAAIAGNPVRIAGRAVTADYTSVATGDTADLITTLGGKLVVQPYAIPENLVKGATSDITTTTSTSVVAAAGAGLKNYITDLLVQNSHATVGTWVNIQDGSGGATLYTIYAAAAGGGAAPSLRCPIPTTANTALFAACVTTGANVRVSASGYKAP